MWRGDPERGSGPRANPFPRPGSGLYSAPRWALRAPEASRGGSMSTHAGPSPLRSRIGASIALGPPFPADFGAAGFRLAVLARLPSALVLFAFLALVLGAASAARADDPKARAIMERVDDRDDGDNQTSNLEMILIDKREKQRVRELRSFSKDKGEDTYSMMFFLEPRRRRGHGLPDLRLRRRRPRRRPVALPPGAQEDEADRFERQERLASWDPTSPMRT